MDRDIILVRYHQLLENCAREAARSDQGRLWQALDTLKVYANIHHISLQEHRDAVAGIDIDPLLLSDRDGTPLTEWLSRMESLPLSRHGVFVTPLPTKPEPWQRRLPVSPPLWQNLVGCLSLLLVLVGIVLLIVAAL